MPSAVGYQPTPARDLGELQERITSTNKGSITAVQCVYVPADDLTDPAPATTFCPPGRNRRFVPVPSPNWVFIPLWILWIQHHVFLIRTLVGDEHYQVARQVQVTLQKYKDLQDIIAILGMDELSNRTS